MNLPLPLTHSWPLFEQGRRFDLGQLIDGDVFGRAEPDIDRLTALGIGVWDCDLADNGLTWSPGVFDLFGLPRLASPARADAMARYAEPSRSAMERLRAHAIRHRRGFTLDVEIVPGAGARRWVRLIAAPVCDGARVVRLRGIKQDVSAEYRRADRTR